MSQDGSQEQAQPQDVPHVLSAYVHDVRYFAALLRGVSFTKMASVTVMDSGLVVTTEESRTLLGTAYIFADTFDEYTYNPPQQPAVLSQSSSGNAEQEAEQLNAAFDINVAVLLECLNILGTAGPSTTNVKANERAHRFHDLGKNGEDGDNNVGSSRRNGRGEQDAGKLDHFVSGGGKKTGMRLSYTGPGYPLTLLIAEEADGPTVTCEVTTFDPEPRLELPFDADQTALRIILKSSWLRDALSEIDPSCEKLTIIGSPPPPEGRAPRASAPPRLRLKAVGNWGSTEMDYPNDREVLETCDCPAPVSFSYKHSHVQKALRALQNSTKTSLRIDEDGLLSLQFLMPSPRARPGKAANAFVEFRCMALEGNS
ncbi:Rad1-domain-containing protein [Trametopsis cervina]|nr:Rad1-domain-containing protein [Trametopsis cervina]